MMDMDRLWIDDLRVPPYGFAWAKTSQQAIKMISGRGTPYEHISFDHDLGGDDTSRLVVLWLCEYEGHWPKTASVHSMNPVGVEWLVGMIKRYGEGCTIREYGKI